MCWRFLLNLDLVSCKKTMLYSGCIMFTLRSYGVSPISVYKNSFLCLNKYYCNYSTAVYIQSKENMKNAFMRNIAFYTRNSKLRMWQNSNERKSHPYVSFLFLYVAPHSYHPSSPSSKNIATRRSEQIKTGID